MTLNYPQQKTTIDGLLRALTKDAQPTQAEFDAIINSVAGMTSVQGEWSEENKTRRLTIAQYVTDQLAIAVDA